MRSAKLAHNHKKESLEIFNIEEEAKENEDRKSDKIFFMEGTQERSETDRVIEDFFPSYTEDKEESIREYRLKRKLYWLFIEYFFMSCSIPLKEMMEGLERNVIMSILNKVNGNQKKAAKVLGIKYTTLNEKIKKYNIRFLKKPF